jgi:hypothetical protein
MFSAKSKSINVNTKNDNTIANLLTPSDLIDGKLAKVDLTQLKTNIIPTSSNFQIGSSDRIVKSIYVNDIPLSGNIVPTGNLVSNLGSPNNWFGNIYVKHAIIGPNSIQLGNAIITSVGDTVSLPIGSTIGNINPGTIKIKGAVSVPSSLPSTNEVGDGFIIGSNLWVSTLVDSSYGNPVRNGWTNVGAFVGPPGPPGPQGVKGDQGNQGNQGDIGYTGPTGERGPKGYIDISGAIFSGNIEIPNLIISGKCAVGKPVVSNLYNFDINGTLNTNEIFENGTSLQNKYAPINVVQEINDLLNFADPALNTLKEISLAMGSDPSFATHVYALIKSCDLSLNNIRTNYSTNNYVDNSLNNIRTNYSTNNYVDNSLNNIRSNYYKILDVDNSLNNYALKTSLSDYALTSALGNYITQNYLTTNYYQNTYVDNSLNNIRTNYSTNNYVDNSLNNIRTNYSKMTYVDNSLNNIRTNYYKILDVDNSLNLNYTTRAYIDNSLNLNYTTRAYIDNSLNLNYTTREYIDNSLNLNYTTRAYIDNSLNLNYTTRAFIDNSLNLNYTTRAYIDNSLNLNYTTRAYIDNSLNLNYTTREYIDNSLNLNYTTRAYIDNSLNLNYTTRAFIDNSLNLNYTTRTYIDNSLNNIRSFTSILDASITHITTNYALSSYIDKQISDLLNGAPMALNSLYELANALNSDVSFGYNTYAKIGSSDLSINNIRIQYDNSFSSTYTKDFIDNSLNINYTTRAFIDNSLNVNYATRAYIDNSLNLNYYKKTQIDISYSNIITNSLVTIGSGTITAGGGFIGTSYRSSAPETDISFGNNLTSGCINIGTTQLSGDITLGDGTVRDATSGIYIGTKSTSGNINIGRGNTISINNSTPSITINRPINLTAGSTAIQSAGANAIGFYAIPITSSNLPQGATSGTNSVTGTGISVSGSGVFSINYRCSINSTTSIASTVIVCGVSLTTGSNNNENTALLGSCWKDDETRTISSGEYIRSGSFIISQGATSTYYPFCKINYSTGTFTHSFSITSVKIA